MTPIFCCVISYPLLIGCKLEIMAELAGLFTAVNITSGTLTVITFCQKTEHDMSSWSPSVEEERDALTDKV